MEALGLAYLRRAHSKLRDGQTLILAGCFSGELQDYVWEVSSQPVPKLAEMNQSNALEADMSLEAHFTDEKAENTDIFTRY